MFERFRLFAPCSGLLLFTLLYTPLTLVERTVVWATPPTPPGLSAPVACPGVHPRIPRPRKPPYCRH
ncbi:MAG TPA: hypothetical protein K8V84_07895 [Nocardiopsis listeri]|uniref:hypothetical protein n=1 Tax=Nocardiopsis listeri TaxID=53440 RepID=UPI001D866979|nr:hypothetical protein [Nocardiopsis listeri]HJE58420.1 hypothetical protein [Nocardiopsis listeri]